MKTLGGVAGTNRAIDQKSEKKQEALHDDTFMNMGFVKKNKKQIKTALLIKVFGKLNF